MPRLRAGGSPRRRSGAGFLSRMRRCAPHPRQTWISSSGSRTRPAWSRISSRARRSTRWMSSAAGPISAGRTGSLQTQTASHTAWRERSRRSRLRRSGSSPRATSSTHPHSSTRSAPGLSGRRRPRLPSALSVAGGSIPGATTSSSHPSRPQASSGISSSRHSRAGT